MICALGLRKKTVGLRYLWGRRVEKTNEAGGDAEPRKNEKTRLWSSALLGTLLYAPRERTADYDAPSTSCL